MIEAALDWTTQVRRGVLEFCVMSLVSQRPRYGYELVTLLSRWEPLALTDGTLYPLLRRLQKAGQVTTEWHESATGPPRKYYHLTSSGRATLERMTTDWARLAEAIHQLQHHAEEAEHDRPKDQALPGRFEPTVAATPRT